MAIHQLFKKKIYFLKIIKYLYQIITIKFGNFVFFLNIDKKNLYNQISIKNFLITPFTISFTKQKSHTIVNYICQVRILKILFCKH